MYRYTPLALAVSLFVSACGGGSDVATGGGTNVAPQANAGLTQNIVAGAPVTLDGSTSSDADANALTYRWTLTSRPAGSTAVLSSTSSARPTFTADVAGTYVASLVVNDGTVNSTNTATVTVTATVANAAPVANAGVAQNVTTTSTVTLDGSTSSDANGDALTYTWALSSRPAGSAAVLSSVTSARPTFTADVAGTYVASLVVNDGRADSPNTGTVSVTATVANAAPVANAGVAQNVNTTSAVTLDGSGSSDANGDALTYSWSLTSRPAGSAAVLSSATSARPTFTADVAGTYVASLVVNDGRLGSSNTSTVSVTATVANAAPVANAGTAQNVTAGSAVTLDGSTSSDANGDALTYRWTLTGRPAGSAAVLSSTTSARPTFTADIAGTYVASLVVNDGRVDSSNTSTVSVTATVANAAPVANAGTAQNVNTGSTVTLDGSASSDANGDALSYRWTLTSRPIGSAAVLSSTTAARPTFSADVAGTYVASLVVNDGRVNSSNTSTVSVTATVANAAPVANAGTAQNVTTGSTVTLDGSASSDANGDALTYAWSLTSRPAGSTAALSSAIAARPTFTADVAGTYVASLIVNDARVSSTTSTVTVTGITPTLSLYTVPSGFFGGTPSLLSFPYTTSASVSASSICSGVGCPTTYKVDSYRLTASALGSFTITGVSATNLTAGSSVVPSFVGLTSGQVIGAGQSAQFDVVSTFTRGQTVNLRYSFTVAETGQTFTYNVSLRTN